MFYYSTKPQICLYYYYLYVYVNYSLDTCTSITSLYTCIPITVTKAILIRIRKQYIMYSEWVSDCCFTPIDIILHVITIKSKVVIRGGLSTESLIVDHAKLLSPESLLFQIIFKRVGVLYMQQEAHFYWKWQTGGIHLFTLCQC